MVVVLVAMPTIIVVMAVLLLVLVAVAVVAHTLAKLLIIHQAVIP